MSQAVSVQATLEMVAAAIRAHRFRYWNEDLLQQGIAAALAAPGMPVEREVRLNSRDRIDLVVGRVGVEVKVAGTVASVRRQVERYLASDRLDGVVLVTNRIRHLELAGERIEVVTIVGAGL